MNEENNCLKYEAECVVELLLHEEKCIDEKVFSPTVPPSAAGISRVVADVGAPGSESGNV